MAVTKKNRHHLLAILTLVVSGVFMSVPAVAQTPAQRVYVVAHGDNLWAIAARFGVTVHALADRNHLAPPYLLRAGQQLRLPSSATTTTATTPAPARTQTPPPAAARTTTPARTTTQSGHGNGFGRPSHPGVVTVERIATSETIALSLRNPSRTAQRRMSRMLRYTDGRQRAIDTRLLRQLALVSDHFGGHKIQVISGFRPFRRGQWTPHSNHNVGRAVDFRVSGVSNRAVRDFCRTLPRTGCGYYPRSVFVHMDVRDESASWVDWSRPGQRPQYGREDRPPAPAAHTTQTTANTTTTTTTAVPEAADESIDDVADDASHVRTEQPSETDTDPNVGTDTTHTNTETQH